MNREDIDNRLSLVQEYVNKINELKSVTNGLLDGINEDCSNNFIHPFKFVPSIIYELLYGKCGYYFDEYYFTSFNPEYIIDENGSITSESNPYLYKSLEEKYHTKFKANPTNELSFGKWFHYDKSKLFHQWFDNGCSQRLRDFEQNDKMIVDSVLSTSYQEGEDVEMLKHETGYKLKFCKYHYNLLGNDYDKTLVKLKFFKEHGVS